MRRFSLYKRGKTYYARFWDTFSQKYTSGLSTFETTRQAALAAVYAWEKYGREAPAHQKTSPQMLLEYSQIKTAIRRDILEIEQLKKLRDLIDMRLEEREPSSPLLLDFCRWFWDYEQSDYIKEKLAFGQRIGKAWAQDQQGRLKHWEEFLGEEKALSLRLKDLTKDTIRDFQKYIIEKVSPRTANGAVDCLAVPVRWAAERGTIPIDPTIGLRKFSPKPKKRGILSPAEATKIFKVEWKDQRCRVANLVAATCGLRSGEVLALRKEDIGLDRLQIRHTWERNSGLKPPKNGEERTVPLLPAVRKELLNLLDKNPWDDGFVFYSRLAGQPLYSGVLLKGLEDAYLKVVLSAEDLGNEDKRKEALGEMKEAGICFHSWRHYWVTNIAGGTDARAVQQVVGHKTTAMTEHYANHAQEENFEKVKKAAGGVFEGFF